MKALSSSDGFVHDPEYLHIESWRMFMTDMGIKVDEYGRVDRENFVVFRQIVERRFVFFD